MPVVQVVERVVEVLKEVPIEVVKEVPVYVKQDVSDMEQFSRNKGSFTQTGAQYSQYTGGTQTVAIHQQYDQSRSGATFSQQNGGTGARGFVSSSVGGGGLASGGGRSMATPSPRPSPPLLRMLCSCRRWAGA